MAYAAVVSLKQTIEGLLDPSRSRVQIPNLDFKPIYDNLCHLKSFFDKLNSLQDSNRVEEFEKSVKDVLVTTQDLIDSHVSYMFHAGSEGSGDESSISAFSRDLLKHEEKLGSLTKTLKGMDFSHTDDHKSTGRFAADVGVTPGIDLGRSMTKVDLADVADVGRVHRIVGLDDERMKLMQMMVGDYSSLSVFSIVGMAGIGKTTLAKEVFFHLYTATHFDIRLFVEIGMEYDLKKLLSHLLRKRDGQLRDKLSVSELGLRLYKELCNRRYLIVLDDVWSASIWEDLRNFFPNNQNGSRIILTSRLSSVASHLCGDRNVFQMRFLDTAESWDLLQEMAFSNTEKCPWELIEIGKTIVNRLGGLPLAIVTVGKQLWMSETSVKNWMAVAQNLQSHISVTDLSRILRISYTQLPQHLKACFVYLGLFPPNYNIPTAHLIKLWVAEGFIEPEAGISLEQKAEQYLEDLVLRNLVIVNEENIRGKIKTCRVHSIIQELCVFEAEQEKMFQIVTDSFPHVMENQRRLGIQSLAALDSKLMQSASAARSLVFMSPHNHHHHQFQKYLRFFKWLRVLHALSFSCLIFPDEVLKLVRLRYLAITYDGNLPSSISRLWNLEVLIIHRSQSINFTVSLPSEIWKLQKLRHLECMGCYLPDPSTDATGDRDRCCMKKLLTLSGVSAGSCTEGVLARMPNLMKLGVWLEPTCDRAGFSSLGNISTHEHLESFKLVVMNRDLRPEVDDASSLICFPSGLRKITLSGCGYSWEHMGIIASLPNLEVLKLRSGAFCGLVWETKDGEFCRLKLLLLESLDVVQFRAYSFHFPRLQQLLFRRCRRLEEIPMDIGEIATLKLIEVLDCSKSVESSAKAIEEEQGLYGNDDLIVRIMELDPFS